MKINNTQHSLARFSKVFWSGRLSTQLQNFTDKIQPRLILVRLTKAAVLLTLVLLTSTTVQAQVFFDWAIKAGNSGSDGALAIAVDGSGNSYVTGSFFGEVDFLGATLTSSPNLHVMFVAKYNPGGNLVWAKQTTGLSNNNGRGIAVDGSGNSYVTGDFRDYATFGYGETHETTLVSIGSRNIFVAKYDPDGLLIWAKQAGGSGDDRGVGIAIDGLRNSYVTGYFFDTANFAGTNLESAAGSTDIFIAKYDPSGNLLWVIKAGGPGDDRGRGIAADASGCYVTSFFSGTANFGPGQDLTSAGSFDIYVARYDLNGVLLWAKQAGGPSNDVGFSIAIDASGNSYVTGFFEETATFGPGKDLTSTGDLDMYVAKYDPNGVLLWAKRAGGTDEDVSASIALDRNGNSYVTGYFNGTTTFGLPGNQVNLTSLSLSSIFVAKYNNNGVLQWAEQASGSSGEIGGTGNGIAVDVWGNSYVTGNFEGSATFGPGEDNQTTLVSNGDRDIFVARFGQSTQSAIYVWRDPDPGRNGTPIDLAEAHTLADFAVAEGIGTIYYDNYGCGDLAPGCPAGAEAQDAATLAPIISLLHEHGLKVEALYTDNTHILDLVSYNNLADAGARFDAIRLDIEEFTGGATMPVTPGDLNVYTQAVAGAGALPVYVSIGHHWDNLIAYPLPADPPKEAFKHILDIVAGVDVQTAQDNSGSGPDARAIERITKEEVCYANSLGKRVDITIETYDVVTHLGLNDFNTFFEEGELVMKNTVATLDWTAPVVLAPCANPKPTGFAYHFYRQSYGDPQFAERKIDFAGHSWIVRQAQEEGPGQNGWSAGPQSVWVDAEGLHLKIRYDAFDGKWYSAQVYTEDYTRHGIHRFNITTPAGKPLDGLDKNVVFGLFLSRDYEDYVAEPDDPFEIDIEFAKWGTTRTANLDYTVWHTFNEIWDPGNRWTVPRTMVLGGASTSSHFIDWSSSKIQLSSFKGHEPTPGAPNLLCNWNTADDGILAADIPKEDKNLRININLWLINNDPLTVGDPPSDGQEVEIIVQDFIFTDPDADNDGIFDEVDVVPDEFSETFSDASIGGTTTGVITTRGDQILTIQDSPYPSPDNGVLIRADASGGTAPATVTACGGTAIYTLNAGNEEIVTCGSVTTNVLSGPIAILFIAADGTPATTTLNAGNTLTFEPETFTFTTPSSNTSPVVVLVNGTEFTMNADETITIAQFDEFDPGVEMREQEFHVVGSFTLEVTSNGIEPPDEDVILEVGTFTTTIPLGSFELDNGEYVFTGVIDGVALEMSITPLGGNEFNFTVTGEGADLTGTYNPVTVYLRIRDDAGTASVMADWFCQNNKVVVCHNGITLCINANALPAHLNHGDYTGPCIPAGGQNLMAPGNGINATTPLPAAGLEVFPNPAGNEVSIQLRGVETATELIFYDLLGKVVWTEQLEEGQISTTISLHDNKFGNGIYLYPFKKIW